MSRGGFKVFDADAHVVEPSRMIEKYIHADHREALLAYSIPNQSCYKPNARHFGRRLGSDEQALSREDFVNVGNVVSARYRQDPGREINFNPHARIADMDREGADVNFILPTGLGAFCSVDVGLELAVQRAYHDFMRDYCAPYPKRLFGAMVVSGRAIDQSVAEIHRVAGQGWAAGIYPALPSDIPLDAPELVPLWSAAAKHSLAIALHSNTNAPPFAPGVQDGSFFDNLWLARSATHPWYGMRNMAAFLGSGVLDRYPDLTVAVLETGHGWLPYWLGRLDEQASLLAFALPRGMQSISDQVAKGRYFQSIELHEGEKMTKYVIDAVGPDVLMFASDYPHQESQFPESVDVFLRWRSLTDEVKQKMLWGNASRCFQRCA